VYSVSGGPFTLMSHVTDVRIRLRGDRFPVANNESSDVFDIIKPGRRIKIKITGSKMSITSDDSLFAPQ